MRNLMTIIKKELRRFFTDRRLLAALIMPGVLIFAIYSVMGDLVNDIGQNKGHTYTVNIINRPADEQYDIDLVIENEVEYSYDELSNTEIVNKIADESLDLVVYYDENFLMYLNDNDPLTEPIVTFHYNAGSMTSMTIFQTYSQTLNAILQPFTVNAQDHSTSGDVSMMVITSLVPFLLITFLFSGAVMVAPESIAGEKERGTVASLLITPVKRSTIAIGKIVALSIVALVSASSSFLGIILSLPKLAGTSFDLSMYTPLTYFLLFLVLISTIFIFIVFISLISAYSKSIKEASSLSTPLMLVIMVAGISSMFGSSTTNLSLYFIPVYNSVNVLLSLFSGEFMMAPLLVTLATNIAVTALGIFLLTRMFGSEKIMFRK